MNLKRITEKTHQGRLYKTLVKYQYIKGRAEIKNGYNVYPWYRLDQNISWFNVITFIIGLLYGLITLKIFKKKYRYLFHSGKFWLPPKWDV